MFFLWYYFYKANAEILNKEKTIASVEFEDNQPVKLQVGSKFNVKACKVLDGFRYEMYLEGGKWIEAQLPVVTKDDANPYVVNLLKTTTSPSPTVTLLKQVGNYWIVDFHITMPHTGEQANMIDLLRKAGLLL